MHMADALVSPLVGSGFWAVSAGLASYAAKKLGKAGQGEKIPLLAVSAAFVFAAQMINFTIPGTGSSGHLGGGLLLAALLGPHAAFLCMTVILAIQAILFADGGLLALGCNIFNLGFLSCYVAYPLIYLPLARRGSSRKGLLSASLAGGILALQLGAFFVTMETVASGITRLPIGTFLALMQPIHLAIGIMEGLATAAFLSFLASTAHTSLTRETTFEKLNKSAVFTLAACTLLMGGLLSWLASPKPDGLEWSLARMPQQVQAEPPSPVHQLLAKAQSATALLPDYAFPEPGPKAEEKAQPWPAVKGATSLAGIFGASLVCLAAAGLAMLVRAFRRTSLVKGEQ